MTVLCPCDKEQSSSTSASWQPALSPTPRPLALLLALSSLLAELRHTRRSGHASSPPRAGAGNMAWAGRRQRAGNMALAGRRQRAWPAGTATPLPAESLGRRPPQERQQARGKCAFREAGRLPFLAGSDASGKREREGGMQRVRWRLPFLAQPRSFPIASGLGDTVLFSGRPCLSPGRFIRRAPRP